MQTTIQNLAQEITPEQDTVNAFLHLEQLVLAPSGKGQLDGLTCGVKDVFDIKGLPTGYGNPTWRATHALPARHADGVMAVLDAGACIVGKTHTDELAFSLTGNNHHYGAPINAAAPDRITGGSSSGSAAAVAANLCDVALGTDTGGSVRAPASFCGLFGMRPTHGAVSSRGVCRLAPSFDTVGWFARDAETLERMGQVLLPEDSVVAPQGELQCASLDSAWDALECSDAACVRERADKLLLLVGTRRSVDLEGGQLDAWFDAFRTLQFHEVWDALGVWVETEKPVLGPGVGERIQLAGTISDAAVGRAAAVRAQAAAFLTSVFEHSQVLVMPTVPGAAPPRSATVEQMEAYRRTAMRLLCIAGLAGAPQISLPLLSADGLPLGFSLIGPRGSDRWLLSLSVRLAQSHLQMC